MTEQYFTVRVKVPNGVSLVKTKELIALRAVAQGKVENPEEQIEKIRKIRDRESKGEEEVLPVFDADVLVQVPHKGKIT